MVTHAAFSSKPTIKRSSRVWAYLVLSSKTTIRVLPRETLAWSALSAKPIASKALPGDRGRSSRCSSRYSAWLSAFREMDERSPVRSASQSGVAWPQGFAHGFWLLPTTAQFLYKCSDYYAPEDEYGILWNESGLKYYMGHYQGLFSPQKMQETLDSLKSPRNSCAVSVNMKPTILLTGKTGQVGFELKPFALTTRQDLCPRPPRLGSSESGQRPPAQFATSAPQLIVQRRRIHGRGCSGK